MSERNAKIAKIIMDREGSGLDPHYLAFFECFNQQLFFEAHEVLEILWLKCRKSSEGDFYKGLIQLAGAFVHVQKGRPHPASSLLLLSAKNLEKYRPKFQELEVGDLLGVIRRWQKSLEKAIASQQSIPLQNLPQICLSRCQG